MLVCVVYCRRSSSGDRLSVTPENMSPSPGSSPGLQVAPRGTSHSGSSLEVAITSDSSNDQRTSSGPTSYHSSTLPLRRHRSKVSAEEKNRKVILFLNNFIYLFISDVLCIYTHLCVFLCQSSPCRPSFFRKTSTYSYLQKG